MVNVLVGEDRVNTAPLKVADVTTGLAVKANAVEGLQCSDADASTAQTATITIQESKDFADAIKSMAPAGDGDPRPVQSRQRWRIATAWW